MHQEQTHTREQCNAFLDFIFADAEELFRQLAPEGWKQSVWVNIFHPTPEQQYEEHIRISANIRRISKKAEADDEPVDINDFQQDDVSEISEYDEFIYLIGLCVYDIFSNNHEIIDPENRLYDLGSARGSGRFIAEFLNSRFPVNKKPLAVRSSWDDHKTYGYMDFYMGTVWVNERGDLSPIYEYIFEKVKTYGADWKYHFPRMYLIDPNKGSESTGETNPKDYNPEEAVQKELEALEKEKKIKEFREELDKSYHEAFETAKYQPLTPIVRAYKNVFGKLPDGHPQKG